MNWLEVKSQNLEEFEVHIKRYERELDEEKGAIKFEADSDKYVSEITLRDTGECDCEIILVEGGQRVIYQHINITKNMDFDRVFATFFHLLRI